VCRKFCSILKNVAPPIPEAISAIHVCDWSDLRDPRGQHALLLWDPPKTPLPALTYAIVKRITEPLTTGNKDWGYPEYDRTRKVTRTEITRLSATEAATPHLQPVEMGDFGNYTGTVEFDTKGQLSHLMWVTNTITKQCKFQVVAINAFGATWSEVCEIEISCFDGNALIRMEHGTKRIMDIRVGDKVATPVGTVKVLGTLTTPVYEMKQMAQLCENVYITRGHPVLCDEEWYRADEKFKTEERYQKVVYNLLLSKVDVVYVVTNSGDLTCATLGCFCPRLAELNPKCNELFGPKYKSHLKWPTTTTEVTDVSR